MIREQSDTTSVSAMTASRRASEAMIRTDRYESRQLMNNPGVQWIYNMSDMWSRVFPNSNRRIKNKKEGEEMHEPL